MLGASALGQLSEVWSELSAAAGAGGRIAEILAVQPSITAPARATALPQPPRGEISFENVTFAYPTRLDGQVVRDLSFSVRPGASCSGNCTDSTRSSTSPRSIGPTM